MKKYNLKLVAMGLLAAVVISGCSVQTPNYHRRTVKYDRHHHNDHRGGHDHYDRYHH